MNLFLIGYRCTGKSSVGKSIADTIDRPFVDADMILVENCGKSIKDIIDNDGWETFRRMECSTLKRICAADRQVVATGGGVVLAAENIKLMQANGKVVWLSASAATIRKRMLADKNTGNFRPALSDRGLMDEIEDMLLQRNPHYEDAADFFFHTDDLTVDEIAAKIIQTLSVGPVAL